MFFLTQYQQFSDFVVHVCSEKNRAALVLSGERDSALCHLSLIDVNTRAEWALVPKEKSILNLNML